jgi:heat shock protein HslJ
VTSSIIDATTRNLHRVTLAVFLGLITTTAMAQSIQGAIARTRVASPGKPVAAFAARAQASLPSTPELADTSWQLVKFQGGDEKILTPDDATKYTIEFAAGGQLNARIDCNRGRGTWKSSGPNQLQFGPLALTRAKCPAGSLHDQMVKQWSFIRSYVTKDGHLFLSLMADGGIYEFEPIRTSKQ